MTRKKTPLEIYALLEKTNCGLCGVPSCMAFAAAVFRGEKKPGECPHLDQEALGSPASQISPIEKMEREQRNILERMKQAVAGIDLASASRRCGAHYDNGRLAINCLGKNFFIDASGNMASECHVNFWIHIPLLDYIITCKGVGPSADWVSFGELENAQEWRNFFAHRCETALRQLADAHGELLFEILGLFGARPPDAVPSADCSFVLFPLPKVPFLINYWPREEEFESKMNILFDRSATENVGPRSLYQLGAGMVEMFRRLIARHNRDGKLF